MPKYLATFHLGADDTENVRLVTGDDDKETLEAYLGRKLTEEKFTAFDDGKGGFTLVAVDKITRVEVRCLDE